MRKHFLNWKGMTYTFVGLTRSMAYEIDLNYRGTLLSRILAMEKKTPITLDDAIRLLDEHEEGARRAGRKGIEPGHLCWYQWNFVEWLSEIGYHIELTGDEFESFIISDKVL